MAAAGLRQYAFDQGLVLARPGPDRLFLLNATAREIWVAREEGLSSGAIAERMAGLFAIPRATAHADIVTQLAAWRHQGLLGEEPSGRAGAAETPGLASAPSPHHSLWQAAEIAAQHTYQVGPSRVGVQYATTELEHRVHPVLAHLAVTGDGATALRTAEVAGEYRLLDAGRVVACERDVSEFAMRLIRAVLVSAMEAADAAMIIHGAAVARGDVCVVLPGVSGSGKSTLAAALASSGFTLLGDDVLILDAHTLRIRPVPMSLNLKGGSLGVLREQYGLGETLHRLPSSRGDVHYLSPPGSDPGLMARSFPVKAMVFPSYRAGAATSLSPVSASTLLSGLLESNSTVPPGVRDDDMAGLLGWLESLPGYRLVYSSLPEAVALIEDIFRGGHD